VALALSKPLRAIYNYAYLKAILCLNCGAFLSQIRPSPKRTILVDDNSLKIDKQKCYLVNFTTLPPTPLILTYISMSISLYRLLGLLWLNLRWSKNRLFYIKTKNTKIVSKIFFFIYLNIVLWFFYVFSLSSYKINNTFFINGRNT